MRLSLAIVRQRVASPRVRRTATTAAALVLAGLVTSCAHTQPVLDARPSLQPEAPLPLQSPSPPKELPGLWFRVVPTDADVLVDGKHYGTVGEFAAPAKVLLLSPGIYQVSLKRVGYETFRAEISIGQGSELIEAMMLKQP